MYSIVQNVKRLTLESSCFIAFCAVSVVFLAAPRDVNGQGVLLYPDKVVVPEKTASHIRLLVEDSDGVESHVICSPIVIYLHGHYLGWSQCAVDASRGGYAVAKFDLNEVSARCAVKCRVAEYQEGRIQGYKDCQAAIGALKASGMPEDQLRKSLKDSDFVKLKFKVDAY